MDDLLSEFLTEAAENLATLDVELVRFEREPGDAAILGSIFRMMHTIKGTCGFLGLQRLEAVAHAGENVLGKFRDGQLQVTPNAVTCILSCIDRIRQLLAGIEQLGQEPEIDSSALIAELNAVAQGDVAAPVAAPARVAPEAAHGGHDPVMSDAGFPVAADLLLEVQAALESGAQAATLEQIQAEMDAERARETSTGPASVLTAPLAPPVEAKAAPVPAGEVKDSSVASASIRVGVDVLENLMTLVSELVLTRNQLLQMVRGQDESAFNVPLQRLSHITSDLQDGVMKTRMQPIGNAWSKLPRIVRDLSVEMGKKIELEMQGAETELDRQVLELIKDPLTHMVRNSADHGLEGPEQRRAAGKSDVGKITLRAYHEGGHIIIVVADDGRGLAVDRIRAKAIANGLATDAEMDQMTERQILQFIFRPGFSTAERVTSVSGRGVGMDVVRTNIEKIGGTIEMQSQAGKGTSFTIKIPLTLAIVSALVVESAKERFAIPQINVVELVRASPHAETRIEMINTSPVLRLRDRLMPLVSLRQLLRQEPSAEGMDGELFIVVAQVGTYSFGIIVDRVFDTEEIVVKPVSPLLRDIPFYSGNTILGDGSVIMILDPNGMAAQTGQVQMGQSEAAARPADAVTAETARMSFLVFRANGGEFKAVPLALVARLEEINLSAVERTRGRHVVQYRNHLMPLVPYDPAYQWKTEGKQPVLVFSEGERSMGLVVDEIVDVVADVMKVQLDANEPGLIGSAVIGGKAMDIIDVGSYLTQAFADWFTEEPERAAEAKAQPRNALIIDPSAFVRELLTPHLAGSGWHVATADNAADAQRLTDSERVFGLVVVGLATPGLDAPAFARRLRENPRWDGTRLAALAECIDEDEAFQLRGAGFHALLAKSNWPALVSDLHLLLTDGLPAETPAEARPGESRGAGHGNGAAKGNGAGAKMEAPAPARNEAARGRRVNGRGAAAA